MNTFEWSPKTAGLLYPDIDSLTDAIYTNVFPEEAPTDHEIKHGSLSHMLQASDLQWLIQREQKKDPSAVIATEPRERTHLYLQEVAGLVDRSLVKEGKSKLQLSRDLLPNIFSSGSFIGTPLAYTDIYIHGHPEGFVLTRMGGGYAGNYLPEVSAKSVPLNKGFEGKFEPNPDNEVGTITIPARKLVEGLAHAIAMLGIDDEKEIIDSFKSLYQYTSRPDNDNHTDLMRYPQPLLATSLYYESDSVYARLDIDHALRTNRRPVDVGIILREIFGEMIDCKVTEAHPEERTTVDKFGNVTYHIDPEDRHCSENEMRSTPPCGATFSVEIRTEIDKLSLSINDRIEKAMQSLRDAGL